MLINHWLYVPLHKSSWEALLFKSRELVGLMEQARGYFFRQSSGRGKPGLDPPPDRKGLDRAEDSVGMHPAEFVTP